MLSGWFKLSDYMYMLQVKIKSGKNYFNLVWFSISFVFQPNYS